MSLIEIDKLHDSEYGAGQILQVLKERNNTEYKKSLHLGVSMRSFRAEDVSLLVKQLLDLELDNARITYNRVKDKYPIVISRQVATAKEWLKSKARGSERYGIVVSSQADRLKPYSINVKAPMDPVHWFLDEHDDVRSSCFLEDVATEFHVQGLELDWSCVAWDADFRLKDRSWDCWSFKGSKWQKILKIERQKYLLNAYRVLMTRARQGMVIVVPDGHDDDLTRRPEYYNETFKMLESIGFEVI